MRAVSNTLESPEPNAFNRASSAINRATNSANVAWRDRAFALLLYIVATALTMPHFMGDTMGYADGIERAGGKLFWEFGHLLWHPAGWFAALVLSPLTRVFAGDDSRLNIGLSLVWLVWLAGAIGVLAMQTLATRVANKRWAVWIAVTGFVFANGFLNYSQTGCAYIASLSCFLVSLCLGTRPRPTLVASIVGGVMLGLAISFWLPFILAIPAALLAPFLLTNYTAFNESDMSPITAVKSHRYGSSSWRALIKERWVHALAIAVCGGIITLAIYGYAAWSVGVHDAASLRTWTRGTDHGATSKGVTRMVFGFARTFINMGADGTLFKRYLLHDPYNPVSFGELFRASLGKLAIFYLFLLALVIRLAADAQGRRLLAFTTVSMLPVIAFAIMWQGGDMERYLALYPAVFLALAYAMIAERGKELGRVISPARYVALGFVGLMVVVNLSYAALPVLHARENQQAARLGELQSVAKRGDVLYVSHQQDELWAFHWTFPFNEVNRDDRIQVHEVLALGTSQTDRWQQSFASKVSQTWQRGNNVWFSKRVLSSHPNADWNWAEGSDPKVKWRELPEFFSRFEQGQMLGGEDGFVLLAPTTQNKQTIAAVNSAAL